MITTETMIGWDRGTYAIERRCDCRKGNRSAECFSVEWHMVSSSDNAGDALDERDRLHDATGVDHRVVDKRTGRAL